MRAWVALLVVLGMAVGELSAADAPVSREEYDALLQRLEKVEKGRTDEGASGGGSLLDWFERIAVNGVLEVEAFCREDDPETGSNTDESDIALATVEVGLSAEIASWVSAEAIFVWQEDDTEPVDLDQAVIRFENLERCPLYLEVGKMYLPFGPCDSKHLHCSCDVPTSNFITDPIVLELGETRETAVRVGVVLGPVDFGIGVFNGDVKKTGNEDNDLEQFVAHLTFSQEYDGLAVTCGAAYINSIADSDGLTEQVENSATGTLDDFVAGLDVWAVVEAGPVSVLAEYVGALETFEANELESAGARRARPRALNVEALVKVFDGVAIAGKYERGWDMFDWQPKWRCGVAGIFTLFESDAATVGLALECLREKYDDGTRSHIGTAQVAVEF